MNMTPSLSNPSRATFWLLTALQLRGVGVAAGRKLAEWKFGKAPQPSSDDSFFEAISNRVEIDSEARARASAIIEKCPAHSIWVISLADDAYPSRLREIKDAPPVIYVKGSLDALSVYGCAVVGTRNASDIGLKIAHRIAGVLAKRQLSTISGLALGIDAAAHAGALDEHGITVTILAHGLDTVAPSSNRKLADRILELGGAWVSEHEPGVPPRPAEFVRRNRLQSGMALCSIIVESGAIGGSIHQARFTKEQGRPVLAVLPDLEKCPAGNFNTEGGKYLVQNIGAIPLRSTDELSDYLTQLTKALVVSKSGGATTSQLNLFE